MGYIIALAGKGGTGKTTVACLLIRLLKDKRAGSILAIDADPNSNLAEAAGVAASDSVGSILEEISKDPKSIPAGVSKDSFINYQVQTAISEGEGFDLLTMGRSEGPGCYCYVNNVLRGIIERTTKDYDYIVIDNEAGLEHLSRRTMRRADALLIVSDPSRIGLKSAQRIDALAKELEFKVAKRLLITNRADQRIKDELLKELGLDLQYLGNIPEDHYIGKISLNGASLMELDRGSKALQALEEIGGRIWQA
ncbi:AAA family ATPase [Candidatus Omnitrophota bacterium]